MDEVATCLSYCVREMGGFNPAREPFFPWSAEAVVRCHLTDVCHNCAFDSQRSDRIPADSRIGRVKQDQGLAAFDPP